jgi:hypothetical protein
MLSYFPPVYPDELLYSVLAHYHRHTAERSPKQTLNDLFGDRHVRAAVDLPGHLGALAERLPAGRDRTPERMAVGWTLYPYYLAFQPETVVRDVLAAMVSGPADGLHVRLGIAASVVPVPRNLRYCSRCHSEAEAHWGELYWRRSHQLPGVLVCPDHDVPLCDSGVCPGLGCQHEFLAATWETCLEAGRDPPWASNKRSMDLLGELAIRSAALLEHTPARWSSVELTAQVRQAVIDRGHASPGERVDQRRLREAFDSALAPLRGVLAAVDKPDWLAAIVRKHRHAFHPLHHILFGLFLDCWASTPRFGIADRSHRNRNTDPGFDDRLRDLAATDLSLRGVARALAVDPNTVRKHSGALGISTSWRPVICPPRPPKPSAGPLYRARWLALQRREPDLGRKALAERLPAEHAWLYRHDREWLDGHSPPLIVRPPPKPRIDWAAADHQLAEDLLVTAERIRSRVPPVRVTLAALEREIGRRGWIGPRRAKLPATMTTLSTATESVEAYQLRRIAWARGELETACGAAPAWKVRRLAGIPNCASIAVEGALVGNRVRLSSSGAICDQSAAPHSFGIRLPAGFP